MTENKRVTLRWAGESEKGILPETLPLTQWTTIGRDFTSLELLPEDVGFVPHNFWDLLWGDEAPKISVFGNHWAYIQETQRAAGI